MTKFKELWAKSSVPVKVVFVAITGLAVVSALGALSAALA